MTGQLTFAFIAGTAATFNPCGFALLPAFVAARLREDGAPRRPDALARALEVGALTTVGFLLVFGTIGTAMSLGARWLAQVIPWAALVIGVLLILIGLGLLLGKRIRLRIPVRPPSFTAAGRSPVLLFGLAYGLTSLSCTLPIFLLVVSAATTGTAAGIPLMFAAYALGMGTILSALAVAAALSRTGVATWVRRLMPYFNPISAMLLIAAGAYVVYYWSFGLFAPDSESGATKPIDIGSRLSGDIQTWLGGTGGKTVSVLLAAVLAGLVLWVIWRRSSARVAPVSASADGDAGANGRVSHLEGFAAARASASSTPAPLAPDSCAEESPIEPARDRRREPQGADPGPGS